MEADIQPSRGDLNIDSAPATSHPTPLNGLAQHRTRNVLRSTINSALEAETLYPLKTSIQSQTSSQSLTGEGQEVVAAASSSIMFGKTWNTHKTTPFYNFNLLQCHIYEAELLAFIVANARNMSSSALVQQTPSGMSTFTTGNRQFPGQIDGSGQNLIDSLDDPGDITGIEFQPMSIDDTVYMDLDEETQNESNHKNRNQSSLMISITVKPKGKTREQVYFCAVILDKSNESRDISVSAAFTHFNLVLLKAPAVIGHLLIQWLEKKFDCKICRLLLQSYELRRIVNSSMEIMYNHAQGQSVKKSRPIELHYTFPDGVSGLKSISVSLPPDEARQLLVSREEGSDSGFLDGIEAHCADSMKIDFDRLNLTRAGCSSWYIASEGKVKIFPAISEQHSLGDFVHKIGYCGT
ncbi:hypothetical protein BGX27_003875 [Mortierella sp. AM989]|nr:hypothetical protein BGX27_003875 [Mortierella sp. AM989]